MLQPRGWEWKGWRGFEGQRPWRFHFDRDARKGVSIRLLYGVAGELGNWGTGVGDNILWGLQLDREFAPALLAE